MDVEREEVASLCVDEWLDSQLCREFERLNGGAPLQVIKIKGRFEDTGKVLESQLLEIPDESYVLLLLHNSVGLNGATFRIDHRVIIDRADRLRKRFIRVWHGKLDLGEYELDLGFSHFPRYGIVHLQMLSLGREDAMHLRGKGYMSRTFDKVASIVRKHFPNTSVSAHCLGDVGEHLYEKHFQQKPLSAQIERSKVREVIRPYEGEKGRLLIGEVRKRH